MDQHEFAIFKAISDFVADLNTVYGEKHKSIALYHRLVSKTTILDKDPVRKHIGVFTRFCDANSKALEEKDANRIVDPLIKYSDRVFVKLDTIMEHSDSETRAAIWNHLLTINALIYPGERSLELLRTSREASDDDFITDIIDAVSSNIDPTTNTNPMAAAMALVSSGKLTDIISSMSDKFASGTLDPEAMLKKVSSMYSKMTEGDKDAPDIGTIISSITGK